MRLRKKIRQSVENVKHSALVAKYIYLGVKRDKLYITVNPSVAIWSLTRKCMVGGRGQPEALEAVKDSNGNYYSSYANNRTVTLQVRNKITPELVEEINNSEGIVVTSETYGGQYEYRFAFIPTN